MVVNICPFQIVFLDTECITYGNNNKFYFVVAINHFTQWIKVRVLRKENSEKVTQFLKYFIIYQHGCLAKIQTDGRKTYVSDAFLMFCTSFGISHTVTAANYPQSNRKADRAIQTLKGCNRKLKVTTREELGRILQLAASSY